MSKLDVYLGGGRAGTLTRTAGGSVQFSYDPAYRRRRNALSLSVSIPLTRVDHAPAVVEPWIDNLLPDNDDVRQRWAAMFGERRPTAFNLLRHMGADCAGAVQVLPTGEAPDGAGARVPVTVSDIAKRLRELRRDDTAWTSRDAGGRWSLGGQQGKIALGKDPNGWYQPHGWEPSTHILKVGVVGLDNSDFAEFLTMRAASLLGLTVARVEVDSFEDQNALVVTRYDRLDQGDGMVTRLHQEDMCQALGLWRASKYQSDGGPSAGDIADLIRETSDPRDLQSSLRSFARANVFSWVAACPDAHAKNYSLLHLGRRLLMAPLYDLISASLLLPPAEVAHEARLAMKLGGKYKLRDIAERHVVRAADQLRVDPDWLLGEARTYATHLPDAVSEAMLELDGLIKPEVAAQFQDSIAARTGHLQRFVLSANGDSPPRQATGGAVWVETHARGGRTVDGHWRNRAGGRRPRSTGPSA